MDTFSATNATTTGPASGPLAATHLVTGAAGRDLASWYYTYAAVVLAAVTCLGGLKAGRHLARRCLWFLDGLLGGAPHTVDLPGPPGLPVVGSLIQLTRSSGGHVPQLAAWTRQYGSDVIRVALGRREAVFVNSHRALAKTIVQQGPAFQSRPTLKLFHGDAEFSGIWTVGTSPYGDRLVRTRKALSSQITLRMLPAYTPLAQPKLKALVSDVLALSQGPAAVDMAEKLHRFATGQVAEQLMGTALDDDMVGVLAETETNIFRHRTIGSPAQDYIPILRAANWVRYTAGRALGIKSWLFDEREEKAREERRTQQAYIQKLLGELKGRLAEGDQTPSILGNILRKGLLSEDDVLLASYTGIAAGVNLGYSLFWIIGYLANRPDLQKNGHEAIREVYHGEAPAPHEFDRVEYVKALHTEGSRMYTPVRLGFPRQTLDGASWQGKPIPRDMLVICNLMAANHDPVAFDRPGEYLPERWLDGRKGRTDMPGEGGDKLGVPHLTYGCGRRVCPGIDMANRGLYSTLVLLLHFFTWERQSLSEEAKKDVFPPFRAERECSLEMDAFTDSATPTEAQAIPWSAGIKFTCRDPEALRAWIASEST